LRDAKSADGIMIQKKDLPKKKQKITKLRDTVWGLCSRFIRLRDSKNGYITCFTCDISVEFGEAHAGHFRHGKNKVTYLMEDNIRGQCAKCNLYLDGNGEIYTLRLIDLIGRERVDELVELSKLEHIWKRDELEQLKEYYKNKVESYKNNG
jgi:hypothetical protein